MKPPTVAESGVGSAGECGLTEGTEVTGATSEVAGDDARFGVQQKVLREERAFPGVGHFRLQGVRISAHPLKEESEASERGRRIALICEPTHTTLGVLGTEDTAGRSPTGFVPWT